MLDWGIWKILKLIEKDNRNLSSEFDGVFIEVNYSEKNSAAWLYSRGEKSVLNNARINP